MKYKIACGLIKGLGPVLIKNIIAYLGDAEALFQESEKTLLKIPGIGPKQAAEIVNSNTIDRAEREVEFIHSQGLSFTFFLDNNYPSRLRMCNDAPIILYHKGEHSLEDNKMISVVGTRQITERGKETTRKIIQGVAEKFPNTTIVSGLAYGVDIYAHRAALEFDLPTIAVMAHGLDRIYPQIHSSEAAKMIDKGALVTEFMSETRPDKQNFVKRNRIIAGLSDVTLVIESAEKGGSLITAHLAQSYNRDVLAVPGRTEDEHSKGCNKLIKTNIAAMVENADDIGYALNWEAVGSSKIVKQLSMFELPKGDSGQLYAMLKQEKEATINFLCLKTGLSVNKVSSLMLQLEFDGLVKSLPGNVFRCI